MPVTIKTGVGGGSVTLDSGTGVLDTTLTLPNINGTVLYSDANGTSNIANITATTLTVSGNVTGNLTIAGTMTAANANVTGTVTAANANVTGTVVMSSSFKRNRIINGNMVIDQRNAGANVTQTTSILYTVDRWASYGSVASKFTIQQNAGSVTPPAGYTKYLGITSSSAYTVGASEFFGIQQIIEGYNIADLGWGAAGAQTVTLSFWVRSSLTGTFGGTLSNDATNRVYPFTYTISSANTWTAITVTVAGDTSGTWQTTTSGGMAVWFNMGAGATVSGTAGAWSGSTLRAPTGAVSVVGTNGATFYVTGVQLEVGTKATPYEMQIYSDQLAQCQRYFQVFNTFDIEGYASTGSVRAVNAPMTFPVQMRAAPTRTVTTAGTLVNVRSSSTAYAGLGLCKLTSTQASASVESAAAGLVQCTNQSETMSAEL